jgi:hypothetical protein
MQGSDHPAGATKLWPFVASAVVPVLLLAPSVIDGTQAIWAEIVATALLLAGAGVVLLVRQLWLRPVARVVGIVGAVLCFLLSLVVMIAGNVPRASTASQQPSGSTAAPIGESPRPASATSSASGPRCWSTARALVDCREQHRFEEIPGAAHCDQATVIAFLGGTSSVDVTTARAASIPGGGCSVQTAAEVMGTARNILQTEAAPDWRRCYDRRTSTNVDCSQPHSGEYTATGSLRRATVDECLAAAARYLDQTTSNVDGDLVVRVLDVMSGTQDPARCIIEARGNHFLSGSIRGLGPRPVPIQT